MVSKIGSCQITKIQKLLTKIWIRPCVGIQIEHLGRKTCKDFSLGTANLDVVLTAEITDPFGYRGICDLVENLLNSRAWTTGRGSLANSGRGW